MPSRSRTRLAAWLLFLLILIGALVNFLVVRRIGGTK